MIEQLRIKRVGVIDPAAIKNNASFTVHEIDTLGWRYCDIVVYIGATDIALSALKVQESDVSGSGQADVPGMDFSVSPATLPAATDDNHIFAFHVNMLGGRKRYLTLVATMGSGSTGGFVTAWADLSRGEAVPGSVTARGLTQELFS